MNLAIKAYTAFKDDEKKALVLSEIFDIIEEKITIKIETASKDDVKESHLILQLEIEKVRSDLQLEIKKVSSDLKLKIEKVSSDLRLEIEKNRTAIEQSKTELAKLMNRQVLWIIGSISLVISLLKALDYVLK